MLTRILLALEDFCTMENINGFASFLAAFNALPDSLSAMAFTSFDDS